jgi:hypothetical protein
MDDDSSEFAEVSILQIKARCDEERSRINKHRPMFKSSWSRLIYDKYTSSNLNDEHHKIVSTLFSGGVLRAPVYYYLELLQSKADDICKGVIFTDNEIAHDIHTFRVFFELDYRGIIPTYSTMMKHVHMAKKLFMEIYPTLDSAMTVSTCDKKVRKNKKMEDEACFGVHLVFTNSATISVDLKRLCATLDCRISSDNPIWSGVVDSTAVHAHHSSLRPNFAYKMADCKLCQTKKTSVTEITGLSVVKKLSSNKSKKKYSHYSRLWKQDIVTDDDEDDDDDENNRSFHFYEASKNTDIDAEFGSSLPSALKIISCGQCFGGRVVGPSSYRLESVIKHDGTILDYTTEGDTMISVHEELKLCSIQRQDIQIQKPFFMTDKLPCDFATSLDIQPKKNGAVFTVEKKMIRGWSRKKSTKYIPIDIELYRLIQPLLRRLHGSYTDCVLHNLMLDSDKKTIIINVKGNGSRYCQVINNQHRSNRVFFIIYLRTGYMHVKCFDQNCKMLREEPLKKRKLEKNVINHFYNQTSTRLPDIIWEQLCVSLKIAYVNTSYTAQGKIQISPAINMTLMTTNSHRMRQENHENIKKVNKVKEVNNLMDFAVNSDLSSLLAGFK